MSADIPMMEVLLKRMETHPEEFSEGIDSSRWGSIIERYSDCLTQPERDKIAQGIRDARRLMMNQAIMKKLAGEEEPTLLPMESGTLTMNTKNRMVFKRTDLQLLEKIKKLEEEREIDAMHEHYKKLGQAE